MYVDQSSSNLKTVLNRWHLVSLGISCVIGAGIFVSIGQSVAVAGPAVIFSILLTAFACLFPALCYAELACRFPTAGSAYSYAHEILGKNIAILVGVLLVLEYGLASSVVAVGFSEYLLSFMNEFDFILPLHTNFDIPYLGIIKVNIIAFIVLLSITACLSYGISGAASLASIMVLLKVSILVIFIGVGVFFINLSNYDPFIPDYLFATQQYGIQGVFSGASIIFFAFMGFDTVSTAASEARSPQKDIPFAIIVTLSVTACLYILLAIVVVGVVHYADLGNSPVPLALVVDKIGYVWLSVFLKVGALIALLSVMLASMYGIIRIVMIMAKDAVLPPILVRVTQTSRVPVYSTWLCGGIFSLVAAFFPMTLLSDVVSSGTLLVFSLVCLLVLFLKPSASSGGFLIPFKPVLPFVGFVLCLILALNFNVQSLYVLLVYSVTMFMIIKTYSIWLRYHR